MPYVIMTFGLQHVPRIYGCHAFSNGVQLTQKNMAAIPNKRFMDTMANQMKIRVRP